MSHFNRNVLSAWTSTNKGQIDDIVGAAKATISMSGTTKTVWLPSHSIQYSLAGTQVTGTAISTWVTYTNWANLNIHTVITVGTISSSTVSYSSGGDLNAITGQTASGIKGTTAIASTSSTLFVSAFSAASSSNGWFDVVTAVTGGSEFATG